MRASALPYVMYDGLLHRWGFVGVNQLGVIVRVLKILEEAELVVADIEVDLGKNVQHAPTLCVKYKGKIIPLNTPDMRPILMKEENAIEYEESDS